MAGIGFSLKRLFSRKGVLAICRAYGYAGIICAGPMVLGVILLTGMALIARLAGVSAHERELMNCMLTYSLLWALTVTSWFNMIVTRYISDMLYEEKPERVMPAFYGSLAIMLTIGAVSYGIFLFFSGVSVVYQLECLWFSLVLVVVWTETVFLTALKDYKGIVLAFAISLMTGFVVALLLVIFGKATIVNLMLCVILAYGMLMCWYYKLLLDYFPAAEGSKFSFLRWLDKYRSLSLIGGFLNIGLFAHLVIMYFGPLRVQVEGLFYGAPVHDVPALVAFFSILITTVNFVTSVEVRFYPKYRNYYSLYNDNGAIRDIEQAEQEMIGVLRQELTFAGHKQFLCTVLFVVLGSYLMSRTEFGFSDLAVGIFRFLCAGYGVYAISNSIMLILLYFEDYAGALLGTIAFAGVSVGVTIYSILKLPVTLYGVGFFCGGILFYLIVWIRLEWYIRRLPYFLLCRQAVVAGLDQGVFVTLCDWLDTRQERLEASKLEKRNASADRKREKRLDALEREEKGHQAALNESVTAGIQPDAQNSPDVKEQYVTKGGADAEAGESGREESAAAMKEHTVEDGRTAENEQFAIDERMAAEERQVMEEDMAMDKKTAMEQWIGQRGRRNKDGRAETQRGTSGENRNAASRSSVGREERMAPRQSTVRGGRTEVWKRKTAEEQSETQSGAAVDGSMNRQKDAVIEQQAETQERPFTEQQAEMPVMEDTVNAQNAAVSEDDADMKARRYDDSRTEGEEADMENYMDTQKLVDMRERTEKQQERQEGENPAVETKHVRALELMEKLQERMDRLQDRIDTQNSGAAEKPQPQPQSEQPRRADVQNPMEKLLEGMERLQDRMNDLQERTDAQEPMDLMLERMEEIQERIDDLQERLDAQERVNQLMERLDKQLLRLDRQIMR